MFRKIYKGLRWMEKFTKTDMVYLVRGGFWLSVGQIIAAVSSFIAAVVFASELSKEEYGTYQYVLAIVGVLSLTTLRSMNISITQGVSIGKEGTARAGMKIKMRWGLLGTLLALLIGSYYLLIDERTVGILLILCAVFIPLKDSFAIFTAILNGKKDFRRISLFHSILSILGAVVSITTLFATHDIGAVFISYFVFWTIANYAVLRITFRRYPMNDIVDEQALRYGKRVSLVGIFSNIAGYFDKVMTYNFIGTVALAVYGIALAPINQLSAAVGNLNSLAMPKFSALSSEQLHVSVKQKGLSVFFVTTIIAGIYAFSANYLFSVFFPAYMEAVSYTQLLAISLPFISVTRLRITALQSQYDERALYNYILLASIGQLVFIFFGGYFFGLPGIVIGTIGMDILQFIFTGNMMVRLSRNT